MAEGKKGFILYADQKELFSQLSDIKAGQLIKHIFKYVNDENPSTKDIIVNLAFTPIKLQLKRDLNHWEDIRQKRSDAGKLGGRPKKQNKANKANASFDKQTKAKKAVIVKVKDKVIVKDIVNVKETINGFDFDYKIELTNYIKHLQENHDRSIGHMQVEQMIKMLDSWYTTKNQKSLCLSANIAGNWKTLNFVEVQTESEKIDYNQGAL